MLAQEILIVQPQFLQRSPRDIVQIQLHFYRCCCIYGAFGDILSPGTGRLDHLVASP